MADIKIKVPKTKVAVVHLVDAAHSSVSYDVLYIPTDSNTAGCSDMHAPIIRCGQTLRLTPQNTPLLLELPGEYMFQQTSINAAKIAHDILDGHLRSGDVISIPCNTGNPM